MADIRTFGGVSRVFSVYFQTFESCIDSERDREWRELAFEGLPQPTPNRRSDLRFVIEGRFKSDIKDDPPKPFDNDEALSERSKILQSPKAVSTTLMKHLYEKCSLDTVDGRRAQLLRTREIAGLCRLLRQRRKRRVRAQPHCQ